MRKYTEWQPSVRHVLSVMFASARVSVVDHVDLLRGDAAGAVSGPSFRPLRGSELDRLDLAVAVGELSVFLRLIGVVRALVDCWPLEEPRRTTGRRGQSREAMPFTVEGTRNANRCMTAEHLFTVSTSSAG